MDERALLLLIGCLGLASLLSALHACLVELSAAALEELAHQRRLLAGTRAASARRIAQDVPGHARAAALARILCSLTVAITSVFLVASLHGDANPSLKDALIGVAVSAVLLWVFTVALPESIARHMAERFVYMFAPVARAVYLLQRPLAPISSALDAGVRKISGNEEVSKEEEAADEILTAVEEGAREGAIDEGEARMIEAVVGFKNRTVEQIMTPRNEIEALEYTNNLGAITAFVRKVRHSRVPVYRTGGGLDEVIGFFYVKDLLRWLAGDVSMGKGEGGGRKVEAASANGANGAKGSHETSVSKPASAGGGGGFELKNILRLALHVPDSKTVRELADEFVAKKVHAAVVVDEYGATTGLVTMEDIIEEVFGDIQDEYENKAEDAPPRIEVKPEDRRADIEARAYINDANHALQPLGVSLPEGDEYDTVGGFVLSALGHMPRVNETFSHGEMTVTVLEASPTRVLRVRVQVRGEGVDGGNGVVGGK